VKLDAVKYPCALAPVLTGTFDHGEDGEGGGEEITESNCMEMYNTFYVNCFPGHLDYELFS
jgi:hypothetical protein